MELYLFYSVSSLGICWFLYHLLLKKEKAFLFNRFYLLGSILLCLLAPALDFELDFQDPSFMVPELFIPVDNNLTDTNTEHDLTTETLLEQDRKTNLLPLLLFSVYLVVSLVFLFRFFKNLAKIIRLIRTKESFSAEGIQIVPTEEKGPFSFFNFVFINREEINHKSLFSSIIKHESAHSKQYHSADILILELISCFFWFNPFIWLYRKAILTNHEFLADAAVIEKGIGLGEYSNQIIQAGNKSQHFQLISGFNYVQTKRRLLMLHADKSHKAVRAVKKISVLSFMAIIFVFCSFSIHTVDKPIQELNKSEKASSFEMIDVPFAVVEEPPVLPGCEKLVSPEAKKECVSENIRTYVSDNLNDDAEELLIMPEGSNVFIQFRIDESGKVTNARARIPSPRLNEEDKAILEKEALRAVSAIPQMQPAKHDGRVVGVLYAIRL